MTGYYSLDMIMRHWCIIKRGRDLYQSGLRTCRGEWAVS